MTLQRKERFKFGNSVSPQESCETCSFRDGRHCLKEVAASFSGRGGNFAKHYHCNLYLSPFLLAPLVKFN